MHFISTSITKQAVKSIVKDITGFSLLEVLIALVLISMLGTTLFSWLNSNLININRVKQVNKQILHKDLLFEYAQLINPMQTPQGEESMGIYQIHWQSNISQPILPGMLNTGITNKSQIGVYQITLQLLNNGKIVSTAELLQSGFYGQKYNFNAL